LGADIKVAINSTKLPPSKGYHIKIYAVDMGDYKNITRFCHLGWYQKVILGGRPVDYKLKTCLVPAVLVKTCLVLPAVL